VEPKFYVVLGRRREWDDDNSDSTDLPDPASNTSPARPDTSSGST
jgi:hypothetical protein